MDVAHEDGAAILLGEQVGEVDHGAGVGVTAAGVGIGLARAGFGPVFPASAGVVQVINDRTNLAVDVGVEVVAVHALVVSAGDDMEDMWHDRGSNEGIAQVVPVDAPGIAGAFADVFEDALGGMVAPHARPDRGVLGFAGL